MVRRLIWSPRALRDLQRLYDFLVPKNRPAARRAIATVRKGIAILRQQPSAGRKCEDGPADLREWPVAFGNAGYLVFYRETVAEIIIIAVKHMSEDDANFP